VSSFRLVCTEHGYDRSDEIEISQGDAADPKKHVNEECCKVRVLIIRCLKVLQRNWLSPQEGEELLLNSDEPLREWKYELQLERRMALVMQLLLSIT
jgi:hypothetical protein